MTQAIYEQLAERHGFSIEAVMVAAQALKQGSGGAAQFNHPELGGMGQWMPNMIMIGSMFDTALKTRVDALFSDLSGVIAQTPDSGGFQPFAQPTAWYPAALGTPSASGGQNDIQYAIFPNKRRIAIRIGENVTVYDTGDFQISGVSQQQQAGLSILMLHTHSGYVPLSQLQPVDTD